MGFFFNTNILNIIVVSTDYGWNHTKKKQTCNLSSTTIHIFSYLQIKKMKTYLWFILQWFMDWELFFLCSLDSYSVVLFLNKNLILFAVKKKGTSITNISENFSWIIKWEIVLNKVHIFLLLNSMLHQGYIFFCLLNINFTIVYSSFH